MNDARSDTDETDVKALVLLLARALCDEIDQVEVTELSGQNTHVLELKVAKSDIGKVIGRQGRTADAIRTLVNCAAAKGAKRYILQIIDD